MNQDHTSNNRKIVPNVPRLARRPPARVAAAIVLAMVGTAIYANSINAGFHFDDHPHIVQNRAIQIDAITIASLVDAARESPYHSRPISNISFALSWAFGNGNVGAFHITNIAIHICTSIAILVFMLQLLSLPTIRSRYEQHAVPLAFAIAVLWMVHPLNVQAVTYVVQRMTALATMFALWSAILLLWACNQDAYKRILGVGTALLLLALAVGSKETALTQPFLLTFGALVLTSRSINWARLGLMAMGSVGLFLLPALIVLGYQGTLAVLTQPFASDAELLLTVPRAFMYGLSMALMPLASRLCLEHEIPFSEDLFTPWTTTPSILGLLGAAYLVFHQIRCRPLVGVSFTWFCVILLGETAMVKHNPFFEHRFYLPGIGLIAGVVLWSYDIARSRNGLRTLTTLAALVGLAWSGTVIVRNEVWSTPITLGRDTVSKAPNVLRASSNYVIALVDGNQHHTARKQYSRMLKIAPVRAEDYVALGTAAITVNSLVDAETHFSRALDIQPGHCIARVSLVEVLERMGRNEEATQEKLRLQAGCATSPTRTEAVRRAASGATIMKQRVLAALSRQPNDIEARVTLGALLITEGHPAAAAEHLEIAVSQQPGHAAAWSNLGFCYLDLDRFKDAKSAQQRALQLAPRFANAWYGLGEAFAKLRHRKDATAAYSTYLELSPQSDPFRRSARQALETLRNESK